MRNSLSILKEIIADFKIANEDYHTRLKSLRDEVLGLAQNQVKAIREVTHIHHKLKKIRERQMKRFGELERFLSYSDTLGDGTKVSCADK